jgi:hypothetical protein
VVIVGRAFSIVGGFVIDEALTEGQIAEVEGSKLKY